MATVNVTLYAGAYLDEADPDYELGKRAAYKMVVPINDAAQATIDAEEGKALTLSGQAASSWSRAAGLVAGSGYVALASPPSGLTLSIGPVTPENVATGKRRISFSSTPPGADHATTWVGWATLGTVWEGVVAVDPGDVPADYSSPGTGLAISMFTNLSVSGAPIVQSVGEPRWGGVTNGSLTGVDGHFSSSSRGTLKIPAAGTYRFRVDSDEGCRLWIDGAPLVDDWTTNYGSRFSGAVDFTLNQIVNIRLDHFNSSNANTLGMAWSVDGGEYTNIPETVMYPIGWEVPVAEAPRPNQTAFGFEVVDRYA